MPPTWATLPSPVDKSPSNPRKNQQFEGRNISNSSRNMMFGAAIWENWRYLFGPQKKKNPFDDPSYDPLGSRD